MSGYIGRNIQSMTSQQLILPRISALDPAGPLYYPEVGTTHLRSTDALFVDVIHTDAGFLGSPETTGTVDFWPNGGSRIQPGCPELAFPFLSMQGNIAIRYGYNNTTVNSRLFDADRCSHSRSWRLWAESLVTNDPHAFDSVLAASWTAFQNGDYFDSTPIQMGINCPLKYVPSAITNHRF